MQTEARVVVIGGGVVGCSILFHLAKFGWKDVVLLERSELTSGSSWHAAGMFHTLSSDPNISLMQGYTIDLYKELEELSEQSVGLHITGQLYLASTPERLDYLKQERSKGPLYWSRPRVCFFGGSEKAQSITGYFKIFRCAVRSP